VRIELASVKAKDVAERWKAQYWYPNGWKDTASGSSEKVYDKLLTAPDDPEVLAKIIGNESWTHIRCHGCNETGKAAVLFGAYGEELRLCASCIKAGSAAIDAVLSALK
jgi:hypothetical protein